MHSKSRKKDKYLQTIKIQTNNHNPIRIKMRIKKTNLKKILTAIKSKRVISNQMRFKIRIHFNKLI